MQPARPGAFITENTERPGEQGTLEHCIANGITCNTQPLLQGRQLPATSQASMILLLPAWHLKAPTNAFCQGGPASQQPTGRRDSVKDSDSWDSNGWTLAHLLGSSPPTDPRCFVDPLSIQRYRQDPLIREQLVHNVLARVVFNAFALIPHNLILYQSVFQLGLPCVATGCSVCRDSPLHYSSPTTGRHPASPGA